LGSAKANLIGITCTYGNSDINTVNLNMEKILKKLGQSDLPGCPSAADGLCQAMLRLDAIIIDLQWFR